MSQSVDVNVEGGGEVVADSLFPKSLRFACGTFKNACGFVFGGMTSPASILSCVPVTMDSRHKRAAGVPLTFNCSCCSASHSGAYPHMRRVRVTPSTACRTLASDYSFCCCPDGCHNSALRWGPSAMRITGLNSNHTGCSDSNDMTSGSVLGVSPSSAAGICVTGTGGTGICLFHTSAICLRLTRTLGHLKRASTTFTVLHGNVSACLRRLMPNTNSICTQRRCVARRDISLLAGAVPFLGTRGHGVFGPSGMFNVRRRNTNAVGTPNVRGGVSIGNSRNATMNSGGGRSCLPSLVVNTGVRRVTDECNITINTAGRSSVGTVRSVLYSRCTGRFTFRNVHFCSLRHVTHRGGRTNLCNSSFNSG